MTVWMVQSMGFGSWLREQREKTNLKQADLAREMGKSRGFISQVENELNYSTGKPIQPNSEFIRLSVRVLQRHGSDVTEYEAFKEAGMTVPEEAPELDREAALLLDQMTEQWNRLRGKVPSREQAAGNQASQRTEFEGNDALEPLDDDLIGVIGPEGVKEEAMRLTEAYGGDVLYWSKREISGFANPGDTVILRVDNDYKPEDRVLVSVSDEEAIATEYRSVGEGVVLGRIIGKLEWRAE